MQCGAELPDGAKFCMSCGARLTEDSADQPRRQTQDVSSIPDDFAQDAADDDGFDFEMPDPAQIGSRLEAADIIDMIEERAFHTLQRSSNYHEYFHPCVNFKDSSERRQYGTIRQIYRQAEKQGEKFLFFYDNTFTLNCKESFLITDRGIHFVSARFQSGFIPYSDIEDMMIVQKKFLPNLIINNRITLPLRFLNDGCDEFCDDMQNIVIPLLMNLGNA